MKLFKLIVHQKGFSPEDLLINQKDYPGIKTGDVVEIYHPDDEFSRLLLQVKLFKDDLQGTTISVENNIATMFQLRTFTDVFMNTVDPDSVALDSIELTFKDQYMGRSEMWRLKNSLVNMCVYTNKKIEFCSGTIRCQVHEMWSQGDRVACGVITNDTKVVFRSSTSMVYLFIQMSCEMWDFDVHGDLYFEKAINGFLAELYQKWKKNSSNHEVTIVLFSRTFYEAKNIDEFPNNMRDYLQKDYLGRYYEDFYRIAVQNEKCEDWNNILVKLRKLFTNYSTIVLDYHKKPGITIPTSTNSTAAQGNFLEVLNMSLNVFEKHHLDRSFDRTGQLSVVITPGVGVFEVDKELTNFTKQRIIDNGVGSDLVCVGEQPLHAVPLFKFHNKDITIKSNDEYRMPHWINLSFYSSNKKIPCSTFIPRIKIPQKVDRQYIKTGKTTNKNKWWPNGVKDYAAYDRQVFQLPTVSTSKTSLRVKKTSVTCIDTYNNTQTCKIIKRKISDPDINHSPTDITTLTARSAAISIPDRNDGVIRKHSTGDTNIGNNKNSTKSEFIDTTLSPSYRQVSGSAGSPMDTAIQFSTSQKSAKGSFNPFDRSYVNIKPTSNRRRWTHIFPKGPAGDLIQQHHHQADKSTSENQSQVTFNDSIIGVDWKSLTIPACLPITTDYFPDKKSLQDDYVVSDYNLLPDDVNADYAQQRAIYKKPLTTAEVFKELVSQRLAQGFQLIILPTIEKVKTINAGSNSSTHVSSVIRGRQTQSEPKEEYLLSIGRIFHKISLSGNCITVTSYRPRRSHPPFNIHYGYRFHAPHNDTYEMSWVSFTNEKPENYSWNYLDHYICTRGVADFARFESLKYWRYRMFLLPLANPGTTKITEGSTTCDVYSPSASNQQATQVDYFIRFIEFWLNKIKRNNPLAHWSPTALGGIPPRDPASHLTRRRHSTSLIFLTNQNNVGGTSPFRERVGSNRLHDKPRPSNNKFDKNIFKNFRLNIRSGSKVGGMDRGGKVSPASEAVKPLSLDQQSHQDVHTENNEENVNNDVSRLKSNASNIEIIEALKNTHPDFFIQHASLPNQTFASADIIFWLNNNIEGGTSVDKGIKIMQNMINEKLICHASGDYTKPFIIGYYFYYIVQEKNHKLQHYSSAQSFENEWVEIEIKPPVNWCQPVTNSSLTNIPTSTCETIDESNIPPFLRDDLDIYLLSQEKERQIINCKHTHLDIDINSKSDRIEWGHLRYQSLFKVDHSFELVVQWVAASGSMVGDLILFWQRKAQMYQLQMVPIPSELISLPNSLKSDPLRGPIFIPLDTECLMQNRDHLFEEFREETYSHRLFLFQEAIIQKFGFIPCQIDCNDNNDYQYVHVTGNAFILLPSTIHQRQRNRLGDRRSGFLWSWNHMISRKGKSLSSAGDELFHKKIIQDFKFFCTNGDNRLSQFWESCWELKEKSCLDNSSVFVN
ncbi:GATOR complex protein Iml1 isoform X3 [Aphidius gifuensis]|uniref:GATOR complex protein Iml1 isoform X3 n=1 Tax=Aphidius gifuensis TaxID=684658 RepID=UPI001CDBFEA7|nr:GATOR complex protein Iml1 isoform X3 [Aphidius gifuensis]